MVSLRRYTELPFLIDLLSTKEIVFLSPDAWEDRNDAHYLKRYAENGGHDAIAVLCFAEAKETFHHWKIFASGSGGVCITFRKDRLLENLANVPGLRSGNVIYPTIREQRQRKISLEDLPFLKRHAFTDEREFRLVVPVGHEAVPPIRAPISLDCIERVTLSPWMPPSVVKHVKSVLKGIEGCKGLRVYHSRLVNNPDWQGLIPS